MVMTERVRSQMQAPEIRFLRKIEGVTMFDKSQCYDRSVTMFDKHRNTAIQESLNIESLLLRIERSQLRWFCHVSRMPQKRLPKQTLYAEVSGKKPVE